MTQIPRQYPFLQRVQDCVLKECKARFNPDPNNDRKTDESEASEFSSFFNAAPKDIFHSTVDPPPNDIEAQLKPDRTYPLVVFASDRSQSVTTRLRFESFRGSENRRGFLPAIHRIKAKLRS